MKRRTINKIVYEIKQTNPNVWVCIENTTNPQNLGVETIYGVPNTLNYAVGSRHTIKTEVPE